MQKKGLTRVCPAEHPTLLRLPLLALPIVRLRQGFSHEVDSSERQVQVVFVTSLDVSVNPSQS